MLQYLLRKTAYGLLVLVLVVVTISSIIYLSPVDPTRLTFGQRADVATVAAKKAELGLDRPLYVQLAFYLRDLSPIDILNMTEERTKKYSFARFFPLGSENWLVFKYPYLRESYQSGRKVSDILLEAIPKTGILALASMGLATILGIFLGVVASLKQNSWFDNVSVVLSVLGYSLPSYVAGILLALLFGYVFADYTGLNVQGSLIELDDLGEEHLVWKNLILPAIAIGLRPVAIITQLTRSSMLEVLSQDYIRTAKAKGLSYYVVVVRHALRNALNPVVTAVSGWFASLLAGAFFVESVFNFKGIGDVMVTALLNFDIPVVLGAVLFTAAIFVVVNLLADVLYALFDPRVRFS
jgi:peptide/nickel transport system permease protein